jgi:hypothetical protein
MELQYLTKKGSFLELTYTVQYPVRAHLCSPNLEMRQNNYIYTRYKSFGLV